GANEELSDIGSLRVIVCGYDRLTMLPVAPPSLDYIPGPEEPHTPPAPLDKDEREPMFIRPHDLDFPLPPVVSPIAVSPGYVVESDPEDNPEEYEDDETEDCPVDYPMERGDDRDDDDDDGDSFGDDADDEDEDEEDEEEEEEEHLALVNSTVVIPTDELDYCPTSGYHSFPPEAEFKRLLAMPTPSPSPLASLSPPSVGEHLARCMAPAALPPPPLPPSLHMPPPVDRMDDILETKMPPCKRLCLSTLGSRYEVGESSIARLTRGQRIDYGFVSTLDAEVRRQGIGEVGRIMAPVTRQGPSTFPNITNPNNMTPKSVQAMIDQALMRNTTNGDGSHSSYEDNRRNLQTAHPCFYADFMKCQPLNFKGIEGVVGLNRWIEKMESTFQVSGCTVENQFVANETEKIDKYVNELPDNIYGSVKASKPKMLDETIEQIMAHVTRQGLSTLPNNTNPNNMTPESVQAMMDHAILRNSTNGDGSHSSHEDNRRNVQTAHPCFYADFMKWQPLNFKGTKGMGEIKKLEIELWNLKYVSGLPDNIYGSMKASKPKMLDATIELANDLMD
nr:hypothetical protein [Tanacetum cinerariifolium]